MDRIFGEQRVRGAVQHEALVDRDVDGGADDGARRARAELVEVMTVLAERDPSAVLHPVPPHPHPPVERDASDDPLPTARLVLDGGGAGAGGPGAAGGCGDAVGAAGGGGAGGERAPRQNIGGPVTTIDRS